MGLEELKLKLKGNKNLAASMQVLKMFGISVQEYALYLSSGLADENIVETRNVKSSNIAKASFDGNTRTMQIEFTTGGVYAYDDVPHEVYNEMCEAESVGRYFQANVRGRFKYRKLR